jgi:general stress protein CsbA
VSGLSKYVTIVLMLTVGAASLQEHHVVIVFLDERHVHQQFGHLVIGQTLAITAFSRRINLIVH